MAGTILLCTLLSAFITTAVAIKKSDYSTGRWFSGDGTYYGAGGTEGGNCAIRSPRPAWMSDYIPVAINNAQYPRSCGACLEISGSGVGLGANPIRGKYMAVVVDRCPECKHGDIDLSMNGDGRWKIKWRVVPCEKKGKIEFQFEGSNPFYRKIQPRNTRSPPVKVIVDGVHAKKSQDNHWIAQKGGGFKRRYKVQVWTITGEYYSATLNKYKGVVHPVSGGAGKMSGRSTTSENNKKTIYGDTGNTNTCVPDWGICRGAENIWNTSGKCCGNGGNFQCLAQTNDLGHKWFQCVKAPEKKNKSSTSGCRRKYERCGDAYKWRTWTGGWYNGKFCCQNGYHCRKAYAKFGGYRCEP